MSTNELPTPHSGRMQHRWVTALAVVTLGAGMAVGATPATTVAAAPLTATFSYTGPVVPIPDADAQNNTQGAATASVSSSGLQGVITDVNFSIDGTACNTDAGSTTVGLDHTFVSDLVITLTSPDGVIVKIVDKAGSNGHNFCQTVLDDSASIPVQGVSAPFTGTFRPAQPLSAFNGGNPNGTWTMTVTDDTWNDTGSIRAFSVIVTGQGADVSSTKTVAGDFAEGGTVTYTVTSTNNGNSASADNVGDEFSDVLPAGLTLVSAAATAGTAVANVGTSTVTWNGALAAAASVTITITATVNAGTQNQTISNQGTVMFDSDFSGDNDASRLTDDPGLGGTDDPTIFSVANRVPSVAIEQASGQADPTATQPVHFTATFSEPVSGFDETDVVVGGAAGATMVVVTGGPTIYDVAVSGATALGAITVSIPAGAASDTNQGLSLASTSQDDTVTLQDAPVPTTIAPATTLPATTLPATTGPATTVDFRGLPPTGGGQNGTPLTVGGLLLLAGVGLLLASRRHLHLQQ